MLLGSRHLLINHKHKNYIFISGLHYRFTELDSFVWSLDTHIKTKPNPLNSGFCYKLLIGIVWPRKETLLYTMFIVIIKINCKDFVGPAAFLSP